MTTALALALLILGLLNLFVKDFVWQLTASGSVIEGLPAERNAAWDLWMNIAGAAALVLAFVFWYFG